MTNPEKQKVLAEAEQAAEGLFNAAVRGVKWTTIATFASAGFQLFFMAVLARLLDPVAFGLMAMTSFSLRFANYFVQMGVGTALVQKRDLSTNYIRASFTLCTLLGVGFLIFAWFAAPLAGVVFQSAEVVPLVRASALSFVFAGLSITSIGLLRREMKFRQLAVVETLSYVLGYGTVGVLFASLGFGVWSLILGLLGQNLIQALLAYYFIRHPLSPTLAWSSYKHLVSFGSRYSVAGFLEFLQSNMATLFVGRLLGEAALGLYSRAFYLVNLPVERVVNSVSKAIYPVFSKLQTDTRALGNAYLSVSFLVGSLSASIAFGMIPAASELVLVILGERWIDAVPVLQILALAVPFTFLAHISGITADALALLNRRVNIQVSSVLLLGALLYSLSGFGLTGFAIAVVGVEFYRFVVYLVSMKAVLHLPGSDISRVFGLMLLAPVLTTINIYVVTVAVHSQLAPALPSWLIVLLQVLVGACTVILTAPVLLRNLHEAGLVQQTAFARFQSWLPLIRSKNDVGGR